MTMKSTPISGLAISVFLFAVLAGCGDDTTIVNAAPPGGGGADPVTAVEACIGCHGPGAQLPAMDITDPMDAHYIDTDPDGPATPSGYRQVNLTLTSVDVRGANVVIEFDAEDENLVAIDDLFAADGRFNIARLDPPSALGNSSEYVALIVNADGQATSERFTTAGGLFENLGGGSYRYTSDLDPTGLILDGDTMRVAIQISAGDIPPGNGWCDFDADLVLANDCTSPVSITRDIVKTVVCNGCHGVTSDTQLRLHGSRTQVEYCVTCHNPGTIDPDSGNTVDFKVMIHKIHNGANLTNLPYQIIGYNNSVHDYSTVAFTKDLDDCTNCHTGGGTEEANWNMVPTMEACQSCHDNVNVATGANHNGGAWANNGSCPTCHPPAGARNLDPFGIPQPVATVHQGVARAAEAALYAGGPNGYSIDDLTLVGNNLTIEYSVTKGGVPMNLATAPEWTAPAGASRLAITVGWSTEPDYTNEGSGAAPANPVSINALDVGGVVTDLGGGSYEVTTSVSSASDTAVVTIEGHPAADLDGDATYSDRIAVKNTFANINVEGGRAVEVPRRQVVDVDNCNQCHDAAGQGISLHGNNRTSEMQVCVVCHNGNNTDIEVRPANPATTADGKTEESIHFRRMIHQIHSGAELQDGIVIYGYGGSEHDYSTVEFIGNRQNCETCHDPGSYGVDQAAGGIASTIDTGADEADPDDDLNVSNVSAVCSSCHDDTTATNHMKLNGGSFNALDEDIL
ncbi:MAG: OmcA/MtrC family decaheme c-type cytochrome [Myxococcales bacterium]|nr:OmcA/MtrC family decaheme c-type cytochrome [Myxococcales bacterium]